MTTDSPQPKSTFFINMIGAVILLALAWAVVYGKDYVLTAEYYAADLESCERAQRDWQIVRQRDDRAERQRIAKQIYSACDKNTWLDYHVETCDESGFCK